MDMNMSDMSMSSSATSMAMNMASSTASMVMSSSTSSSMDMSGMSSMHMYFTTDYNNYPVIFKNFSASNKGQAFGIFLFLFVIAFLTRGLEYVRNYLEQVVWKNPVYVDCHPGTRTESDSKVKQDVAATCCNSDTASSVQKNSSLSIIDSDPIEESVNTKGLSLASTIFRDIIRLALCILPDLFGFALMLAVMTFTLTYFFAVVLGLGIGRFFFERLSEHHNIKPMTSERLHC